MTTSARPWPRLSVTRVVHVDALHAKENLKHRRQMSTEIYIGLGSNLDHPAQQITNALRALAELPETTLLKAAPWYQSRAIGPGIQADYINTVAALSTELAPLQLLNELQGIEKAQGRKPTRRWGPRCIDLDILLFGQQQISEPTLSIPHPRLGERNFVIYPLADIAPDLVLPDATPLQQLLANSCAKGIVRLEAGEFCGSTG